MTIRFDVVIIGGGVAGGALAAAIAHLGGNARVLLVEQTRKSGAINRGDFIAPPHLEICEEWGVLPELLRRGGEPVYWDEMYDNRGNLLLRHDMSFYQSKYRYGIALEHPEIEAALLAAGSSNPHLTIWRGARFDDIAAQDGDGVTVRIVHEGRVTKVMASWVVAADGRLSRVRQEAGIESPMHSYPYEIVMARMPKPTRWHQSAAQFIGTAGYCGVFVVNGEKYRLALPIPDGTFATFMQKPEAERNAEIASRAPQCADMAIDWTQVHSYRLHWHHAPAYVKGRVILLGDAAHSFTPVLGMGMNLAMEDARDLAPLLANPGHLTEQALKQLYERKRRPRNQRILRESNRQGPLLERSAAFHYVLKIMLWIAARLPTLANARFRAMFS